MNEIVDVLVVGAGGAGLTAAIHAKQSGASVLVVTKEYPTRSQTCMAQGGMNAALGNVEDDSVQAHIDDTLKSAHGLADENAVAYMCNNAPEMVRWLDSIGVCFSRTNEAKIAQRKLGGAYAARACYAQDYTGLKILHTLYDKALASEIEILNERFLLEICQSNNQVTGAHFYNIRSGEIETYRAKTIVLATGGYSRVYDKNSTNSTKSTGDGIAVALRAGAKTLDMEFVQFHPTGLKSSSILISESARGAGGYLLNSNKERFVDELLPRDQVSRAIDDQIKQGQNIFLDIRHLGEKFIDEELPQERKLAILYENVDPLYDVIPVKPVAHYTMGGIAVDDSSSTNIKGLFAAGECANHRVHGANRLGGNSLLEIVVFGKQAGKSAAQFAKNVLGVEDISEPAKIVSKNDAIELNFYEFKEEIGDLFYEKVGIVRSLKDLEFAKKRVDEIRSLLPKMGVSDDSKACNTNKVEFLEFINTLDICDQIIDAALLRKESVGAHCRVDE